MVPREEARWRAVIRYRTDDGSVEVTQYLDELKDLHRIVERGPHWDTVLKIEIFRVNHIQGTFLTVEGAQRL